MYLLKTIERKTLKSELAAIRGYILGNDYCIWLDNGIVNVSGDNGAIYHITSDMEGYIIWSETGKTIQTLSRSAIEKSLT